MPRETQRYAICVRDNAVLIVDATSVDEALDRAHQVMHLVERAPRTGETFTVRPMPPSEPARVDYFTAGYFQMLAESSSSTKH